MSNPRYDFFGGRGEELYFRLREEYAQSKITREIEFDIAMMKYQGKITKRNLEENKELYGAMAMLGLGVYSYQNVDSFNYAQHAKDQVKAEKWAKWIEKNTK